MNIPADLKYTSSHEWVRTEADGTLTIGITDTAQEMLGDLVFVGDAKVGETLKQGDTACVVESVKAASDIYAPVTGVVAEVNAELGAATELVNQEPYGAGWFFKLQDVDPVSLESLMTHDQYRNFCGE